MGHRLISCAKTGGVLHVVLVYARGGWAFEWRRWRPSDGRQVPLAAAVIAFVFTGKLPFRGQSSRCSKINLARSNNSRMAKGSITCPDRSSVDGLRQWCPMVVMPVSLTASWWSRAQPPGEARIWPFQKGQRAWLYTSMAGENRCGRY